MVSRRLLLCGSRANAPGGLLVVGSHVYHHMSMSDKEFPALPPPPPPPPPGFGHPETLRDPGLLYRLLRAIRTRLADKPR
jgi:hypothetical protein